MAERVSTGGTMQFEYRKGQRPKPTKEYKLEIEQAYNKYYDRKKKEKRNRTIMWIVVVIIVLLVLGFLYFR